MTAELKQLQQEALLHLLSISQRSANGADAEKSSDLREKLVDAYDEDEEEEPAPATAAAAAKPSATAAPIPPKSESRT